MIDKLFYISLIIILIILKPEREEIFNPELNFIFSIIYIISLIYFLRKQRNKNKNWLRFDVIFLTGYTIVHFEIPFLASIGIEPERPDFIWPNQDVVNFATWMSSFSIALWMLGYSLIHKKDEISYQKKIDFKINYFLYDLVMLIAFIVFLLTVGPSLFRGEYAGAMIWGEGAVYPFLITRIMLNLRVIYFIINFKEKITFKNLIKNLHKNKIFFLVLFFYIFIFLSSGKRGNLMQLALTAATTYILFIKPISLKKLIIFLVSGAFIFTLMALGRGANHQNFDKENIFSRGYASFQETENKSLTGNLASSVRIQYRALDMIPDAHPYLNGITYLMEISGTIPFLSSTISKTFDIPKMYHGTANFFTILHQGTNIYSGDGSELLSDIYVNFSIYGVFIFMFLFGIFSKKIYESANKIKFIYILIYIVLVYSALSINRGTLLTPLKDIAYILFFHFLFSSYRKKPNFQLDLTKQK